MYFLTIRYDSRKYYVSYKIAVLEINKKLIVLGKSLLQTVHVC